MNRRIFIKRLSCAAAVATMPVAGLFAAARRHVAPPDNPKGWRADGHYCAFSQCPPEGHHVFWNGIDVQNAASECNVNEGWAMIYPHKLDAKGRASITFPAEWDRQAWDRWPGAVKHFGKVEIRPVA